MLFERKKLHTETLGEYLRSVRENLELPLEQAAKAAGIKLKFLEDLEEGNFLKLPADVYVIGFLKQLTGLYNIDFAILVEQYKKERNIQQRVSKPDSQEKTWKNKVLRNLVVTPKLTSLAIGGLFVLVTLGYIVWQVSSIDKTPSLEIFEPQDRQIIKGSAVSVRGKTDPGMSVTVNGQNLFVDSKGEFKAQLGITSGPKELVIIAKNRFDKATAKTISLVGEGESVNPASPVQLKLEFSDEVSMQIRVDDQPEQALTFHSGDVKQFSGQGRIIVSTSDAGATRVTLNGTLLGPLGRAKEQLKDVSFFPESGDMDSVDN